MWNELCVVPLSSIWFPLFWFWWYRILNIVARLTLNSSFGSCSLFSGNTSKLSSGLRRAFFVFLPGKVSWRAFHVPLEAELPAVWLLGRNGWLWSLWLGKLSWRAGGQPADLREGFKMPVVRMLQNIRAEMGWGDCTFCSVWSVVLQHSLPPQCFHWLTYLLNRGWGNSKWSCTSISFSIHPSIHSVTFFSSSALVFPSFLIFCKNKSEFLTWRHSPFSLPLWWSLPGIRM